MAGTGGRSGDPRRAPSARAARVPAPAPRPARTARTAPAKAAPEPAAAPPDVPSPAEPKPARELSAGDVVAGRYVLLEQVGVDGPAVLWRAQDEVLARPVAVKCVPTPNRVARLSAQAFLDAAVRAGAVTHPGIARVFDAAPEPRPGRGNDVACVISEWVDGEPLDAHLERVGALAPLDAADLLRQVADALAAAHAQGLVHGRVHPRNVLVSESGRVRLTDLAVGAALHGTPPASVADDTRDLGAVLYALLTCRWPADATPQPGGALREATVEHGHLLTPRQLRAGVPREVDHVVTRALEPRRLATLAPLLTPAALADAADASVAEARAAQVVEERAEPRPPSRLRRAVPWFASAAFVAVVGVLGWTLGLAVGDLPRRSDAVDAILAPTDTAASPGAPARPALSLAGIGISDFDPLGKDKKENPDQVQNAIDKDTTTAWSTSAYRTADFSGLKPGVGLVLDLRKKTALHSVDVGFSAAGAKVEVRVADVEPTSLEQTRVVAASTKGSQLASMTPLPGTSARWVVIWITSLPERPEGGYQVGVSALRLT